MTWPSADRSSFRRWSKRLALRLICCMGNHRNITVGVGAIVNPSRWSRHNRPERHLFPLICLECGQWCRIRSFDVGTACRGTSLISQDVRYARKLYVCARSSRGFCRAEWDKLTRSARASSPRPLSIEGGARNTRSENVNYTGFSLFSHGSYTELNRQTCIPTLFFARRSFACPYLCTPLYHCHRCVVGFHDLKLVSCHLLPSVTDVRGPEMNLV